MSASKMAALYYDWTNASFYDRVNENAEAKSITADQVIQRLAAFEGTDPSKLHKKYLRGKEVHEARE